jgi:hypothetical protein
MTYHRCSNGIWYNFIGYADGFGPDSETGRHFDIGWRDLNRKSIEFLLHKNRKFVSDRWS